MDKATLLELYKLYRAERYQSFTLHRDTLQHYLAFAVALLGATILGILEVRGLGWTGLVIELGPISNILICILAIQMCNRFYLGAMERISILVKLESLLELHAPLEAISGNQQSNAVFPQDRYLLPERWSRGTQHDTSAEFIQQHLNAGVNRVTQLTFVLLIGINVLLGAAVVPVAFL